MIGFIREVENYSVIVSSAATIELLIALEFSLFLIYHKLLFLTDLILSLEYSDKYLFVCLFQLNMQEGMEGNPMAGTMKKFSRGLAVMTVPFTASFPKVHNYNF